MTTASPNHQAADSAETHQQFTRVLSRVLLHGLLLAVLVWACVYAVSFRLYQQATANPQRWVQWLEQRLQQPVSVQQISPQWRGAGPWLVVHGLQIGSGDDTLNIERSSIRINLAGFVVPHVDAVSLYVRGSDLTVEEDAAGAWHVDGFQRASNAEDNQTSKLSGFDGVYFDDLTLVVRSHDRSIDWHMDQATLRVQRQGDWLRISSWFETDSQPLDERPRSRAERLQAWFAQKDRTGIQTQFWLNQASGDGRVYVRGHQLDLGAWLQGLSWHGVRLPSGVGSVEVWSDIQARKPVKGTAHVAFESLRIERDNDHSGATDVMEKPHVRMDLAWERQAGVWRFGLLPDASAEQAQDDAGLWLQVNPANDAWQLEGRHINLGHWLSWLSLSPDMPEVLRAWLANVAPDMPIDSVFLSVQNKVLKALDARVARLVVPAANGLPGGALGAVTVQGGDEGLVLELDDEPLTFDGAGLFQAPLNFRASGRLALNRTEDGWWLGAAPLSLRDGGFPIDLEGGIQLADGAICFMDIAAEIGGGDLKDAHQYWMVGKMAPEAVAWLNDGLQAGKVAGGKVVFRGDPAAYPFAENQGIFHAQVALEDATIKFQPDWPAAENAKADASFINQGMQVKASGDIRDVHIDEADVAIVDFLLPVLTVKSHPKSRAEDVLDMLKHSSLYKHHGEHFDDLSMTGAVQGHVDLRIPLLKRLGLSNFDGSVDLLGVRMKSDRYGLEFDDAHGPIKFTRYGLYMDGLTVKAEGEPADFSLKVGRLTLDEPNDTRVDASLQGAFNPDPLLDRVRSLHWLKPYLNGHGAVALHLNVPRTPKGVEPPRLLTVTSAMQGIQMDLPKPLFKPATQTMPLRVEVKLPLEADGHIKVALGERLNAYAVSPPNQPFAVHVALGKQAQRPSKPGLWIDGQAEAIDAVGWGGFMASMMGKDKAPAAEVGAAWEHEEPTSVSFEGLDVLADALLVNDRRFSNQRVQWQQSGEAKTITLDGDALQGSVRVPQDKTQPIQARFERLHWPKSEQTHTPSPSSIAPKQVPPLDVMVNDLQYGDATLGRLHLATSPSSDGLTIDTLETESDLLRISAKGIWRGWQASEQSNISMVFDAPSLGGMLSSLGFSELIEQGKTIAKLDAHWRGGPQAFALANVQGTLNIDVREGSIPDVEPGAGRFLGLLSVVNIPRRLALDFRDFFQTGFRFESIKGTFTFNQGFAVTDDLHIQGSAADIAVRGKTDLINKQYHQALEVTPQMSGVLPTVGAVTAGPAGAMIGLVASAILSEPMKEATRVHYSVRGAWDAPVIEKVTPEISKRITGKQAQKSRKPKPKQPAKNNDTEADTP